MNTLGFDNRGLIAAIKGAAGEPAARKWGDAA